MPGVAEKSVMSLQVTLRPDVLRGSELKVLGLCCDVCHVTFETGRTFLSGNATERWSGRKPSLRVERP